MTEVEFEEIRPKISLKKMKNGALLLTVEDYNVGFLDLEIWKESNCTMVFDWITGFGFSAPLSVYETLEQAEGKGEEVLWKAWKELMRREEEVEKKIREERWKTFKEIMQEILEILKKSLEGKEVRIDIDPFLVEKIFGEPFGKISLKAAPGTFWLIGRTGEEKIHARAFKPWEILEILYRGRAEREEKRDEAFKMYEVYEDDDPRSSEQQATGGDREEVKRAARRGERDL